MGFGYSTTFSLLEWLALTGLVQGLLIIVYIVFRVRAWRQAALALTYFTVLTAAFGLQFALRLEDYAETIRILRWAMLALGPPLCYLLVLQIAFPDKLPRAEHFSVLLLPVIAFTGTLFLLRTGQICDPVALCPAFFETLYWLGAMSGSICMLFLWGRRDVLDTLWKNKKHRERYWLVVMLAGVNVLSVSVSFLRSTGQLNRQDSEALWITLGMAFLYLASTALFRIYPAPLQLNKTSSAFRLRLTSEEKTIADKIQKLMDLDKVYHEQSFSRADLAREVGVSESVLSKVINAHFGKSFPRLLNEYRVEDAKRMLNDPHIPVQVIAVEVGFNSIASFNRAFREVTGESPTSFRSSEL